MDSVGLIRCPHCTRPDGTRPSNLYDCNLCGTHAQVPTSLVIERALIDSGEYWKDLAKAKESVLAFFKERDRE